MTAYYQKFLLTSQASSPSQLGVSHWVSQMINGGVTDDEEVIAASLVGSPEYQAVWDITTPPHAELIDQMYHDLLEARPLGDDSARSGGE